MGRLVVAFARLLLRVFFRRVGISHGERIPRTGPAIFVLNHPNGLVDPLFILSFAGRPVSFLAKEPLFRMFFVGACLRSIDALPVYRNKDQANPKQNRKTFEDARRLLKRGGSIALFPEGTSHSDPSLKRLKTGAARIALGAASGGDLELRIVPVGLGYSEKQTFRSEALVCVGEPFEVAEIAMDADGEPPPDAVHALTERIAAALGQVTVQADRVETLRAIALATRIFAAEEDRQDLARAHELGQRLASGEARLRPSHAELVRTLTDRVCQRDASLRAMGISESQLTLPRLTAGFVLRRLLLSVLWLPLSVPALLGVALNVLPYWFVGFVARRVVLGEVDVLATAKLLAATVSYPVSWAAVGLVAWGLFGARAGLAVALASPVLGYLALVARERLAELLGSMRALWLWGFKRRIFAGLVEERRALRDMMSQIAESWSI